MSLLAELGVNATDVSLDDVEKSMAGGGLVPEGVHHAVLTSVGGIPNADGRGWKFTFEVIAGPGKGGTIEEALWKPKGSDEKKDAATRNRVLLFGHRLGLLAKVKGADGKEHTQEIAGKHDFCDCLGATCFLEVVHEDEEYTKDGKTRHIKKAKLTFNGLLSPDDKRVKDVPKAAGAAASAAVSKAATAAAAKPKDNFEGL